MLQTRIGQGDAVVDISGSSRGSLPEEEVTRYTDAQPLDNDSAEKLYVK